MRGEMPCPWVTEGTAAKVLGSEVSLEAKLTTAMTGTCVFRSRQASGGSELEVEVSSSSLMGCPGKSEKLRGIGSEAVQCEPARSSSGEAHSVVESRVRKVFLRVTLSVPTAGGAAFPAERQREIVTEVAEQVAGNLF